SVNDRVQLFIDQARLKFAAGIQEVMPTKFRLVGPFFVAIPQRDVQFSGNFAAPFFLAFLLGFLNGLFDSGQGFLVALRDHNADTVFRLLAFDSRFRLEYVAIRKPHFTRNDFSHLNLLLKVKYCRVNFRSLVAFGSKRRTPRRFFDQTVGQFSELLFTYRLFKLSQRLHDFLIRIVSLRLQPLGQFGIIGDLPGRSSLDNFKAGDLDAVAEGESQGVFLDLLRPGGQILGLFQDLGDLLNIEEIRFFEFVPGEFQMVLRPSPAGSASPTKSAVRTRVKFALALESFLGDRFDLLTPLQQLPQAQFFGADMVQPGLHDRHSDAVEIVNHPKLVIRSESI